jgi:hypothetical protein
MAMKSNCGIWPPNLQAAFEAEIMKSGNDVCNRETSMIRAAACLQHPMEMRTIGGGFDQFEHERACIAIREVLGRSDEHHPHLLDLVVKNISQSYKSEGRSVEGQSRGDVRHRDTKMIEATADDWSYDALCDRPCRRIKKRHVRQN